MQIFQKMKDKWGVGPLGLIAILLAFALAGMTTVRLRNPVIDAILPEGSPEWSRWVVYALVIFPMYQLLLLGYGALLGKFHFFWGRAKRIGRWLARQGGRRRERPATGE